MGTEEYYKAIWYSILEKCQAAITEGELFFPCIEKNLEREAFKSEFSLGSRYLPRGFYCPSPDIECFITNMRRGRIAKRLTKKSKPSHHYLFKENNKLYLVKTFYPNGTIETEHIFYKQNVCYGFIYNSAGQITSLSVEEYLDNRLCNYLWAACCYCEADGYRFIRTINEKFRYLATKQLETDTYIAQAALGQVHMIRNGAIFDLDQHEKVILNSRTFLFGEETIFST